jgi:hypothetical protein
VFVIRRRRLIDDSAHLSFSPDMTTMIYGAILRAGESKLNQELNGEDARLIAYQLVLRSNP